MLRQLSAHLACFVHVDFPIIFLVQKHFAGEVFLDVSHELVPDALVLGQRGLYVAHVAPVVRRHAVLMVLCLEELLWNRAESRLWSTERTSLAVNARAAVKILGRAAFLLEHLQVCQAHLVQVLMQLRLLKVLVSVHG